MDTVLAILMAAFIIGQIIINRNNMKMFKAITETLEELDRRTQ